MAAPVPPAAAARPWFEVELVPGGRRFSSGLPVLDGCPLERLFRAGASAGQLGPLALFHADGWLLGAAVAPGESLAAAAHDLYASLFAATRGWHLARIWNYVPAINAAGPDGLENYRAFNAGRSRAFEAALGPDFRQAISAASAVGADTDVLTLVFAATKRTCRHVENPRQVPAYAYPAEYGPRPPSFARATVVPDSPGRADVFISGTASIRGHATVAPAVTLPQLGCTLENLRGISTACGLGPDLARGRSAERHFKVYLRHAADLPVVKASLERELLGPADRVSYLRSDICRRELNVEIEATVLGAQRVE